MCRLQCELFYFKCGHVLEFWAESLNPECSKTVLPLLSYNWKSKCAERRQMDDEKDTNTDTIMKEGLVTGFPCSGYEGDITVTYPVRPEPEHRRTTFRSLCRARKMWFRKRYMRRSSDWQWRPLNAYYLPINFQSEVVLV